METKPILISFLLAFAVVSTTDSAWAKFAIHSQSALKIKLTGYNGLTENTFFKGDLMRDSNREIDTAYRGLALLVFADGQRYPVIIGEKSFTLQITDPVKPPSFAGSEENNFLYKSLSGSGSPPEKYGFALIMIQAKNLLRSSQSIRTVKELTAKKKEFHGFVAKHYIILKHSDMIRRLIAQYFMMHEHFDYRTEGTPPATDLRAKYQKEVINGVANWLETLSPHLPEQEILNYCVSLYYKRSMVTLASQIIENFRDVAYCPGDDKKKFSFPDDLLIAGADGNKKRKLAGLKGNKLIAFVSEECPVSMVETISKVRQLAAKKENITVIVAPLQKLSSNHLVMARMISSGKMLFINDEKWRKTNLPKQIKLPLFVWLGSGTRPSVN